MLGRVDQQVKFRGFRIELGEIETVLSKCSLIKQVAVIKWTPPESKENGEHEQGLERLVAYVTLNISSVAFQEGGLTTLHLFAKNRMPAHQLPAQYIVVDQLPLTASGKINRQRLPPPTALRPRAREAEEEDEGRFPLSVLLGDVFL